jgi:hypothetical protein
VALRTSVHLSPSRRHTWQDAPDVEEEARMPEDARPQWSRDHAPTQRMSPVPPAPDHADHGQPGHGDAGRHPGVRGHAGPDDGSPSRPTAPNPTGGSTGPNPTGANPAAWWTRPLPPSEAEPEAVPAAQPAAGWYAAGNSGYAGAGYADPGYADPGYADPGYADPGYADPGYAGGGPATYGAPGGAGHYGQPGRYGPPVGAAGRQRAGLNGGRRIPQALAGRRRALTVLGVFGGVPLLAALAVVALLPDAPSTPTVAASVPSRPAETAASRASREPTAAPSTTASGAPGQPADLAPVATDLATGDLRRAGITVEGTISSAWGWTDGWGRSLVVSIVEVTSQAGDGSPTGVGLRAYYLTGLDGHPTVQRKLKDPSLHCSNSGAVVAGFTPAAFGVRDLDGDGSSEVMVGWTARCADPGSPSRVRLAVMAGNKLYVLRGTGVVTGRATQAADTSPTDPGAPSDGSGATPGPAATDSWAEPGGDRPGGDGNSGNSADLAPVPAASQWPGPMLQAALTAFHSVYF